jgi:4-diphosphocytidyl-2-C-methyl-D-erythritol kinase
MKEATISAPAKINLTLDVLGKRADGYHELQMVMQSVSLCDAVTLTESPDTGLRVQTNLSFLPDDDTNIAAKAAHAFAQSTGIPLPDLTIAIDKQIPVCAGTAGGSSDGAAVLRGLNDWFQTGLSPRQLAKIGEAVGSDVPYCVLGGTALAEGRGEVLTQLPQLPPCTIVLCKPAFAISTPELFRQIDHCHLRRRPDTHGVITALEQGDLRGVAMRMYNVFEDVLALSRKKEIEEIKNVLIQAGALGACMSGTGPTVFGIFDGEAGAKQAAERLRQSYKEVFLTRPV